jgi:hypothetical protein
MSPSALAGQIESVEPVVTAGGRDETQGRAAPDGAPLLLGRGQDPHRARRLCGDVGRVSIASPHALPHEMRSYVPLCEGVQENCKQPIKLWGLDTVDPRSPPRNALFWRVMTCV